LTFISAGHTILAIFRWREENMRALLRIATVMLSAAFIWAQGGSVAQIHGVVQDSSGAAVPGAQVRVTQTDTGVIRNISSDADGSYVLSSLPLGPYRMEVSKEGFNKFVQEGIVLQVNGNPLINPALKVGSVSEQIVVEANVTQVETRSSGVGTVIETQRILDLPLNGRQATDLITLNGIAVQMGVSRANGMRTGITVSVAGGSPYGVQYNLDGAQHLNYADGSGAPLPFPDALQEFKLSTSTQDPANAGHSGAVINAVTKSGTNAFHGDLFEFVRNYAVNARDFFATQTDGLKRNQYGGVLGGPIKKDKLFFFVGYQGTRVRQTPLANQEIVPTPEMYLTGDLTAFNACSGAPPSKISPQLLSRAAQNIAARLPKAINSCGLVYTGVPLSENDHEASARVDYQMSTKQNLFARYMVVKQLVALPFDISHDPLTGSSTGGDDMFNSVTIGDTYLLSPTMVNSFRLAFNRIGDIKIGAQYFGPADVGIHTGPTSSDPFYTYLPHHMAISVNGGFTAGNTSNSTFEHNTAFGFNEDFNMVRGAHQFAFGGFFTRVIEWKVGNAFGTGNFTFSNMAAFLQGNIAQFRQANPNPLNMNQNVFGLYAQDTWKLTPKLTMTYGVNWSPFLGLSFQQGDLYNFSLARFYAGQRSTVIPSGPPGFTYPGDPGFPGKSGINSRWGYFDPRVGLAWDPFGDGKTAIRVGAGIAHDSIIKQDIHLNTSSVLPFRLSVALSGLNLDNPYPSGDPFPYTFDPAHPQYPSPSAIPCLATTCPPTFLPIPPDIKPLTQYSWNFGIQRQITPNWFASGTYIGTHILHLWGAVELNPAIYIPGSCSAGQYGLTAAGPCTQASNVNQRRVLNLASPAGTAPLSYITQYDDGGTQTYHGFLLNTALRIGKQLNLNANYTWSHCIGLPLPYIPATNALNPGANYVHQGYGQNIGPADRNLDNGDCFVDRRHVGNLTVVYQTPKFSNRMARVLATGWTFASSFVVRSGQPLTILSGTTIDPATGFGGTTATQRADQLLADTNSPARGQSCSTGLAFCENWFNPKAFKAPVLGTFGNSGVGALLGPAFWQWDQAISRDFRIREGQTLVLRFEVFNPTNSLRPGNPGTSVGAPSTFGIVSSDATPPPGVSAPSGVTQTTSGSSTNAPYRVLQFALKYVF
jgi:Carboxypeptidase regulatory-like domain/TonB dependent receptor